MEPSDAATLIIVRDRKEVLLGARSARHVFMPHVYVFPGGRLDPADELAPAPHALRPPVEAKLLTSVSRARARGLAMAAVRETFEETGLSLSAPAASPPHEELPEPWRLFFESGQAPALHRVDYLARAITPAGNVRRYDARFFIADAEHLSGTLRSNGELLDLRWQPLEAVGELPLGAITELVLELVIDRFRDADTRSLDERLPLYRQLFGSELVEHH